MVFRLSRISILESGDEKLSGISKIATVVAEVGLFELGHGTGSGSSTYRSHCTQVQHESKQKLFQQNQ